MIITQVFNAVRDQNLTLNTLEDCRLLLTSIGVMSSFFTRGNIEGIKASSRTAGTKCANTFHLILFIKLYYINNIIFFPVVFSCLKKCQFCMFLTHALKRQYISKCKTLKWDSIRAEIRGQKGEITFDLFIKWTGLYWRRHLCLHRNIIFGCKSK